MQLAPLAWAQYHQFVELSVDAFHASETLVPELAVMWIRRLATIDAQSLYSCGSVVPSR
jgi:hypothetical protein